MKSNVAALVAKKFPFEMFNGKYKRKERESDGSESEDEGEGSKTPPKKKKRVSFNQASRRKQKFRPIWRTESLLSQWVLPDPDDVYRAKCKYCIKASLKADHTVLVNHATSNSHLNNMTITKPSQSKLKLQPEPPSAKSKHNTKEQRAAIKTTAFFVEHNVPFRAAKHHTALMKKNYEDSPTAQNTVLGSTKMTAIAKKRHRGNSKGNFDREVEKGEVQCSDG